MHHQHGFLVMLVKFKPSFFKNLPHESDGQVIIHPHKLDIIFFQKTDWIHLVWVLLEEVPLVEFSLGGWVDHSL